MKRPLLACFALIVTAPAVAMASGVIAARGHIATALVVLAVAVFLTSAAVHYGIGTAVASAREIARRRDNAPRHRA